MPKIPEKLVTLTDDEITLLIRSINSTLIVSAPRVMPDSIRREMVELREKLFKIHMRKT